MRMSIASSGRFGMLCCNGGDWRHFEPKSGACKSFSAPPAARSAIGCGNAGRPTMLMTPNPSPAKSARDPDPEGTADWLAALDSLVRAAGAERAEFILAALE